MFLFAESCNVPAHRVLFFAASVATFFTHSELIQYDNGSFQALKALEIRAKSL